VQILPDRAAHRAWDPNKVVQPAQSSGNGGIDQIMVDQDTAPGPDPDFVQEIQPLDLISDDETSEPAVADEDICAGTKDEVWQPNFPRRKDGAGQVLGSLSPVKEVGGPPDPKGGVGCQGNAPLDSCGTEPVQ
jgi:hypothetical protein